MSLVVVFCLVAGFSEAAGRVLPLVSRRSGLSRSLVIGLLLTGTLIEATVIALWPRVTLAFAEVVAPDAASLVWTPGLIAPLVLAAVLAFPMLGPLLHLLLLMGVGAGLAGQLAAGGGLGWWAAVGCVTAAGVGLAFAVELVRRLVSTMLGFRVPEPVV